MNKFDNLIKKTAFIGTSAHSQIIKLTILFFLYFLVHPASAQEGTRTPKNNAVTPSGKIMVIPFEPKLYMTEIDMKIYQETKWSFAKIRENFRHQLDAELKLKLQKIAPVVSFYSDSVKMAKDLAYIYQSTVLSYELIPVPGIKTVAAAPQKGITNGQITVAISDDKRFMSIKPNDTKLLPYLNKKYKSDYFVFVNQLDIVSQKDSYNIATDTFQREITVHYTILNTAGKVLSSGISVSHFSSKENNPKKIISISFPPIAGYIADKLSAGIAAEHGASEKK